MHAYFSGCRFLCITIFLLRFGKFWVKWAQLGWAYFCIFWDFGIKLLFWAYLLFWAFYPKFPLFRQFLENIFSQIKFSPKFETSQNSSKKLEHWKLGEKIEKKFFLRGQHWFFTHNKILLDISSKENTVLGIYQTIESESTRESLHFDTHVGHIDLGIFLHISEISSIFGAYLRIFGA